MKKLLLSSAVVLALSAGGYTWQAAADTDPAAGADQASDQGWGGPGDAPGGHDRGPMHGPGHCGPGGPQAGLPGGPPGWPNPGFRPGDDKFGLFAPVKDKNLSVADVKTIAAALLLEHGKHDWSVSGVAISADKSIGFSFTTPHGDVIAAFEIDPASGRIKRVS